MLETFFCATVNVYEMTDLFSFVKKHQTCHDYYSPGNRQFLIWIQTYLGQGLEIWACPEICNMKTGLIIFLSNYHQDTQIKTELDY